MLGDNANEQLAVTNTTTNSKVAHSQSRLMTPLQVRQLPNQLSSPARSKISTPNFLNPQRKLLSPSTSQLALGTSVINGVGPFGSPMKSASGKNLVNQTKISASYSPQKQSQIFRIHQLSTMSVGTQNNNKKSLIMQDDENSLENLNKKFNEGQHEYQHKLKMLEQLKSEFESRHFESQYLTEAELNSKQRQSVLLLNSSTLTSGGPLLEHAHQMKKLEMAPCNNQTKGGGLQAFMSLRVQTTGNELVELDGKISGLIDELSESLMCLEREQMETDTLNQMKQELSEQAIHDNIRYKRKLPKALEMEKSLENLEQAKFINQTRIHTSANGVAKCKEQMLDFRSYKEERLLQKRQELTDHELEVKQIKQILSNKQNQLEEAKKKLLALKRENESIKIDQIIAKFFATRHQEESLLNKLEMLNALQLYLKYKQKNGPSSLIDSGVDDLKGLPEYQELVAKLNWSAGFETRRDEQQALEVSNLHIKRKSTTQNLDNSSSVLSGSGILQTMSATNNAMSLLVREREKRSQVLTSQIETRWQAISNGEHKLGEGGEEGIDEATIVKQNEKSMIRNQLLNVTFDDMVNEKNTRKNTLESLRQELTMLKAQALTSTKLMTQEQTYPESMTSLKFEQQNKERLYQLKTLIATNKSFRKKVTQFLADLLLKVSTKLARVKKVAPMANYQKMAEVIGQYMEQRQEEDSTPSNNQTSLSGRRGTRLGKSGFKGNASYRKEQTRVDQSLKNKNMNPSQSIQQSQTLIMGASGASRVSNSSAGSGNSLMTSMLTFTGKQQPKFMFQKRGQFHKDLSNKKMQRRRSSFMSGSSDEQENGLFTRIQGALRDHLRGIMNMDLTKLVVLSLHEQIIAEQSSNAAPQNYAISEQEEWGEHSEAGDIFNKELLSNIDPKYVYEPSQARFNEEYKKCQEIFDMKPKLAIITAGSTDSPQNQSSNSLDLKFYQFRLNKKQEAEEDYDVQFAQQRQKEKDDRINLVKNKELAILKEQMELKKITKVSQVTLRLSQAKYSVLEPPPPVTSQSSTNENGTNNEQHLHFGVLNKTLVDFRQGEAKFINRFSKECDEALQKLNKFTIAVMPPSAENNNSIINNRSQSGGATLRNNQDLSSNGIKLRGTANGGANKSRFDETKPIKIVIVQATPPLLKKSISEVAINSAAKGSPNGFLQGKKLNGGGYNQYFDFKNPSNFDGIQEEVPDFTSMPTLKPQQRKNSAQLFNKKRLSNSNFNQGMLIQIPGAESPLSRKSGSRGSFPINNNNNNSHTAIKILNSEPVQDQRYVQLKYATNKQIRQAVQLSGSQSQSIFEINKLHKLMKEPFLNRINFNTTLHQQNSQSRILSPKERQQFYDRLSTTSTLKREKSVRAETAKANRNNDNLAISKCDQKSIHNSGLSQRQSNVALLQETMGRGVATSQAKTRNQMSQQYGGSSHANLRSADTLGNQDQTLEVLSYNEQLKSLMSNGTYLTQDQISATTQEKAAHQASRNDMSSAPLLSNYTYNGQLIRNSNSASIQNKNRSQILLQHQSSDSNPQTLKQSQRRNIKQHLQQAYGSTNDIQSSIIMGGGGGGNGYDNTTLQQYKNDVIYESPAVPIGNGTNGRSGSSQKVRLMKQIYSTSKQI